MVGHKLGEFAPTRLFRDTRQGGGKRPRRSADRARRLRPPRRVRSRRAPGARREVVNMIQGAGHSAVRSDVGSEGGARLALIRGKVRQTVRSRRSGSRARRLPRTSPRCSARRLRTRPTEKDSAATPIGCSSPRATRTRGRRPSACGPRRWPGVPRAEADGAPHGAGSERPQKIVAWRRPTAQPRRAAGAGGEVGDDPPARSAEPAMRRRPGT